MLEEEVQTNDYINDGSSGDDPIDYTELVEKDALKGEYTFEVIQEGIETQFNNYIRIEDNTNYVEIFYKELENSFIILESDEEEYHKDELREVLNRCNDRFEAFMDRMFKQRLSLTVMGLENEESDDDEAKDTIQKLYEYFILKARSNFISAISKDIRSKIHTLMVDDANFLDVIRGMLNEYSPLVIAIGPMEFIDYNRNEDVKNLFNTGKVNGNFLRKYSPKLYDNEDLEVEIINNIVLQMSLRRDLEDGRSSAE